jgi:predicted metal-binding membrane protein
LAGLRRIAARPTLWVELMVVGAWAVLVLGSAFAQGAGEPGRSPGWAAGPLWVCTTGVSGMAGGGGHGAWASGGAGSASALTEAPMWALMAVGMMVPAATPAVRHVAGKSLWWRRRRAVLEFLLVFVGLWFLCSALVLGLLSSWGPVSSPYALAVALSLAAFWQLTPMKQRALRACHRSRPLPPRGWRASTGVANFALHNGTACLASCWAMMLAAGLAAPGTLLWMGAMTGVMAAEKTAEAPQRAARQVAALLSAAALGVLLANLI